MKCHGQNRNIYQWLDGELKGPEKMAFEAHLKGCSICQHEMESSRAFHVILQASSLSIEPSSNFEPNFWEKIYARQEESWLSKVLRDIESLFPVPTFSQAFAVLLMALFIGGAGGAVSATNTINPQNLEGARTSIKYLSGFQEFKGIPTSSMAASYLKVAGERSRA